MASIQYIEIDSTYRNRNNWPDPAEFEVLVSQSGRKDKMNADDPVSCSVPLNNFRWSPNGFSTCDCFNYMEATIINIGVGIGAAGDNNTVLEVTANSPTFSLQPISNYYTGAVLLNVNTGKSSRITSYTYLGQNSAQITIDGMPNTVGNTIKITNPTDLTTLTNAFMFVPNGRTTINAYPNSILYNNYANNYVKILGYDPVTRLLKLADITGLGWSSFDKYSIRTSSPQLGSFQQSAFFNNGTQQEKSFFSLPTNFSDQENIYKNSFILSNSEIRRITRYETLTGKLINTITIGLDTYLIFPINASNINGYYNGFYITILSGAATGEVRKIMSYTVTGTSPNFVRTATVESFTANVIAGDDFTFRSGVVDKPFTNSLGFNTFEIFPFCYDNHNPLVYTGSMQQESVCYQIELLDLILPNKILNAGNGGRIAFYPYVYVELSNVSGSSSGTKNAIYSNNPNATSMVFRVPIYDVQNPTNSSFVKLDGDGMIQTLKFKPNDNIFFSVRLSNGELFKTVDAELYNPFPPNPEIQISAIFSFKRV